MHHNHSKKLGIARVKAHTVDHQQLKYFNRILLICFSILSGFALLNTLFTG
ncbi:hypothetical protein MNBD_GAMMA09-1441 [hydrothermal vent metagenome]|uniref:Uncharacterized protein n=1 Tax=hydrothermal vent metagenome TaxID=652676 RepID=A0A3B0XYM4_9ZZZZ